MNLQPGVGVRGRAAKWLHQLAASVSPNPRVLLFVVVGWVTELVLLACVRDNIYDVSREARWLAIEFTAWFWVTTGWVVWLAASRLRHPLARAGWGALLAAGFTLYGLSWGLYLRTSRFLDWDALQFAAGNFRLLWMYARQAEHGTPLALVAGLIAVVVAIIASGPWLARGQWSVGNITELRRLQRMTWYSLGLGSLLLLWAGDKSENAAAISHRLDTLRNGLHPAVTLAVSSASSTLEERVTPCLELSELRPLQEADTWNRTAQVTHRANVILITVESMRHDVVGLRYQGQEVMPVVSALARGGAWFTRAYAQATQTDYSTTALYSSLFPLRAQRYVYFHPNDPWPKTLFYDVLKPAGYATAIISSQNAGWSGMDSFLQTPRLDLFYDPQRNSAPVRRELSFDNLPDSQTVDKAISWIGEQGAHGQPFFLGLNLQTPHFPYKLPAGAEKVFQPAPVDFYLDFFKYPIEKVEVMRNGYYNALRESDRQIGRLLDALRASGQLSHTIVIVTGDHGEAFYEEPGYVTHGREPIEPVIRTAWVVSAPGLVGPQVDDYPVELIDVLPTALGLLGLRPHPNFQGIDVLNPIRPPLSQRLLFFHTETPVAHTDAVLWMGRWKYVYDRQRKRESLFDVETSDTDDLSGKRPEFTRSLREVLQTWRRRQLAYYRFPFYYERYFPPAPPAAPTTAQ